MKIQNLVLVALFVILLSACSIEQTEWQTFTSASGNFSVSIPGELIETFQQTETPLGFVESHVFRLNDQAADYSITYTDYPVPGLARANPLGALEGAVLRTLDSYSAALVSKKDVLLDNAPGIEFRGTVSGGQAVENAGIVHGRVYLYDSRLYHLVVVLHQDNAERADAVRFFDSFHWLKEDTRLETTAK